MTRELAAKIIDLVDNEVSDCGCCSSYEGDTDKEHLIDEILKLVKESCS